MDRVLCLTCGQVFARESVSARIERARIRGSSAEGVEIAPDGDAIVSDVDAFVVPDCTVCGGHLKPDVVFFGEFIPAEKYRRGQRPGPHRGCAARRRLVAGRELRHPAAGGGAPPQASRSSIVNRGETKGDARATVKLNAGTTETLVELSRRLA